MLKNELTRETTIPNSKAAKNVATVNPGTICPTNIIIATLITNAKRPKDKIVIGNVNSKSSGFIKVFIVPSTIATITAVCQLATSMPGTIFDANTIETVLMTRLISNFIFIV